jgi:predicted short-subunit dehydrogenase-like oxidoreductase (DUF2520 family)
MTKQDIFLTFVGAGNVAWHLAAAWDNTLFQVREVYSRSAGNAQKLTGRLYNATVVDSLDFSESPSRVFLLTLPDDSLEEVAREIVLPDDAILVHCSGSRPLSILKFAIAAGYGVCYPLQTFTKGTPLDVRNIPFSIESNDPKTEEVLSAMVKAISTNVRKNSSEERLILHLAAVFASNFTNHMLTISSKLMHDSRLTFDLLHPLIVETINKSLDIGPINAQTGPARRGDLEILDKHISILESDPAVKEIYRVVSQHILDKYNS